MFAKSVEMFLIGLLLVALLAFGQVKYWSNDDDDDDRDLGSNSVIAFQPKGGLHDRTNSELLFKKSILVSRDDVHNLLEPTSRVYLGWKMIKWVLVIWSWSVFG